MRRDYDLFLMKHVRFTSVLAAALLIANLCAPVTVFAEDADTDGDDIIDLQEDANGNGVVDANETDPYNADTDGGGESDGSEIRANRKPNDKTDDMTYDRDGDGWVNGVELIRGTDPAKADSDADGTNDSLDPFPLDPKYAKDANANNLPDEWEQSVKLDTPGTDTDALADPDKDGLTNKEEFEQGLNPVESDTDHDGVTDEEELKQKTDPRENACLEYGAFAEPFQDMKGHWAEGYVFRMQQTTILPDKMPIIRGYTDAESRLSTFAPDKPVTRFEFLKMVLLSTCTTLNNDSLDVPVRFTDVLSIAPENESADASLRRRVIYTAVRLGIVQGYPTGMFLPDAQINRAEALKILMLASQLKATQETLAQPLSFADVKTDDWFTPYVRLAVWAEIVSGYDDGTFKPDRAISRSEAAKMIYKTMLVNPFINGYVLPGLEADTSMEDMMEEESSSESSEESSLLNDGTSAQTPGYQIIDLSTLVV